MYDTYEGYSTHKLLEMADEFREAVAALNGAPGIDYSRVSLPHNSPIIVSADKDGVRYNFSSSAIVHHVLGDLEEMSSVMDEARRRLYDQPRAVTALRMLDLTEREVEKCLTLQYVREDCTIWDVMAMARPQAQP